MNYYIKSLKVDEDYTIKDKIEDLFLHNRLSIAIRKFIRFIKRLCRWLPILWKQEEWDFGYTYDIIKLKLQELRKNISEDTWHTSECVQEALRQIDSVLDHLDKYRNWTTYIEIPEPPKDFERFTTLPDGCSKMNWFDGEHEAYEKASEFETEHYNAFWDEMKQNSGNWWT